MHSIGVGPWESREEEDDYVDLLRDLVIERMCYALNRPLRAATPSRVV